MTVHGDGLRRQECYGFRRFLIPHDGAMPRILNVYITGLDEATTYTFAGQRIPQESAKLGGCQ
jgi:hypothetical protein